MKVKAIKLYLPLIIIMMIGFVWRTVNFERLFVFAHDQDLYSWIAKDIVVNHHQRLVGQITSVDGVFIGSFYYYLMAVFYWLSKMNPMSAVIPVTAIGMFNIWSIYYVVLKHFDRKTGILAGFLLACSFGVALFDRWSVPTQPTITWCIWFLAVIFELYKGNWKCVPLYGFLVGFTWQVHIALLPVTTLPIIAYFVGDKFVKRLKSISWKWMLAGIFMFMAMSSPFWMFEIKHNFSQIKAMAVGSQMNKGGPKGMAKVAKVLDASGREMQQRMLYGYDDLISPVYLIWLVIIAAWGYSIWKRSIELKLSLVLIIWMGLIMFAQFWSKRIVSEYYFTNLLPIVLIVLSVFLSSIKRVWLAGLLMASYLTMNLVVVIRTTENNDSYKYRLRLVEWIRADQMKNNYPCVAINYISKFGDGVGFRYLFWYKNVQTIKPGTENVPVYNVFIPRETMPTSESGIVIGRFGVAKGPLPKIMITKQQCDSNSNQLDPLLGYTE